MYPIIYANSYFTITTLGVLSLMSLVLFVWLLCRNATKSGRDIQFISDHFWILLIATLIGGRLQVVIEHWPYFSANFLEVFYSFQIGTFGFFGALIGFFLALYYYCSHTKESFKAWLDIVAASLFLPLILMYFGQFLDGSNYGTPTDLPWGISYENQSVPYTIPVHPTQLYFIALTLGSYFLYRRFTKASTRGTAGIVSLLTFSIGSFLITFLSGEITMYIFSLRTVQVFAIMFTVILIILYSSSKK